MGPSPTYHPPEAEGCETSVERGLPLWAEPAVGYCSWQPRPPPIWGSRFVGARAVGPWVNEQKPLGKTPLRCNPSTEMTYLPTFNPWWYPPIISSELAQGACGYLLGSSCKARSMAPDICEVQIERRILPREEQHCS